MSQVCIISGCSRGIGRAIAMKLGSSYSLGLLARSENELNQLKDELELRLILYFLLMFRRETSSCFSLWYSRWTKYKVSWIVSNDNNRNAVNQVTKELGPPIGLVNVAGNFK